MLKRDSFGVSFRMHLDREGMEEKRSIFGGLCTLILTFTVILFAYQKAEVLVHKKDVDILSTINDMFFTPDHVFNYERGFNVALGFTAYDSNPEPILEPEIGEILFNHFSWGQSVDGVNTGSLDKRNKFPHHSCSSAELGLDEKDRSESKFLPVYPSSLSDVKFYQKKLMCADTENLFLYGDYNSSKASLFNI